jgi:hypothetical protein
VTQIAMKMHNRLERQGQWSSKCDILLASLGQISDLENIVPFDCEDTGIVIRFRIQRIDVKDFSMEIKRF